MGAAKADEAERPLPSGLLIEVCESPWPVMDCRLCSGEVRLLLGERLSGVAVGDLLAAGGRGLGDGGRALLGLWRPRLFRLGRRRT